MSQDSKDKTEVMHWADKTAERVIELKGDRKQYTVAAGITPSGTVHIGNFREIITVDLVKRALESKGKKVRFIYSWDDYDVFRKVPANMPKQDVLQKYLRKSIVDVPDTFGCHKSYAEHHEKEIETSIPNVGIFPEFLYQAKKYRAGEYDKEMKHALEHNNTIKSILNDFRTEEVDDNWVPIAVFCASCGNDTIKKLDWLGGYKITYACECGHEEEIEFNKKHIAKLKWRVDWPMRWNFEKVDFEPGGKDHSTVGGSYDTGKVISKKVWNYDAPEYVMYDFIIVKGQGGKMSSSKGNVTTLKDTLDIYEPEIVRYLFASTRPNAEFAISFDADVIKIYEDFDKCERIAFDAEPATDKEKKKQRRIYELSCVDEIPKALPYQPGFRHLTLIVQIAKHDIKKAAEHFKEHAKNEFDKKRLKTRLQCAKNWLEKHAPDEFKFSIQEKISAAVTLNQKQKDAVHTLAQKLAEKTYDAAALHGEFYTICKEKGIETQEFFTAMYNILINKNKGPRLANFIIEIDQDIVLELLKKLK